jgi:uncharacterized membrane protein
MAGELVGDKLPSSPNRIVLPQVAARATSGALVGATLYKAKGGNAWVGALVGSLGTVAATYATFWLRKQATEKLHIDSGLTGAGEDALVLAGGLALSKTNK